MSTVTRYYCIWEARQTPDGQLSGYPFLQNFIMNEFVPPKQRWKQFIKRFLRTTVAENSANKTFIIKVHTERRSDPKYQNISQIYMGITIG